MKKLAWKVTGLSLQLSSVQFDTPEEMESFENFLRAHNEDKLLTVQEVWEAAGGNPGINASKEDTLTALRLLDEICEESDARDSQ